MLAYVAVMVAHRALFHGKTTMWIVNFFNKVTDRPTDAKLVKQTRARQIEILQEKKEENTVLSRMQ